MKNIICCLMLMAITSSCRAEDGDYHEIRAASYQILIDGGRCSGTMIADGIMLTAKHCVRADMKINGKSATLLRASQQGDAALLSVDTTCPCIPVADKMIPKDYKVVAVGYPVNLSLQTADEGRYQGVDIDRDVFSASVMKGKSGGGVFAKFGAEWRLVGMTIESTSFADASVWTYTIGPKFSIIQELLK